MKEQIRAECRMLVVGDASVLEHAAGFVESSIAIRPVQKVSDAKFEDDTLDVYDLANVDVDKLVFGKVSADSGRAAFESIKTAIELAMDGQIDGTVTAPINKESINMAGHHFAGHTEIYAHFTGVDDYCMMLAEGVFRVVHVSTHVSLREACDRVKKERILTVIRLADKTCKDLGIERPKIAVAGLNPHCGEAGLFGTEDDDEIKPAVTAAQEEGIDALGPLPADTVFPRAKAGMYDVTVVMYHDQGHIPLKLVGFVWDLDRQQWNDVSGVNITLGLPIIRTSVDHGTAFGKAGKGIASESSLVNAISYAVALAQKTNDS